MSTHVVGRPGLSVPSALALVAALLAAPAFAQEPAPGGVVPVDVAAVDRDGRPVSDLTAADFELREKGHARTIVDVQYVAPATRPRTAVFLVDDLALSFDSVHQVRRAIASFVDVSMASTDRVGVLRTAVDGKQKLTADKKLLQASVEGLLYNNGGRSRRGGMRFSSTWSVEESLRSLASVIESVGAAEGRKSIVLFSDGMPALAGTFGDSALLDSIERLVRAANERSVVIHAVDARGLTTRFGRGLYRHSGMERLAYGTGGTLSWSTDVRTALERAMSSEAGHYVVRFEAAPSAGKAHSIQVRVKRPGVTVRTRREVFAPKPRGESI